QCHTAGTGDPTSGTCSTPAKANGTSCSDGNACTTDDACQNGSCVGGPPPNCDDGNVCTDDSCDRETGNCVNNPNTAPCDDDNNCTTDDTCSGGSCIGQPVVCDDGVFCNGPETCDPSTSLCVNGLPPSCDDGGVCTSDASAVATDPCTNTPTEDGCSSYSHSAASDACNGVDSPA